jgi:3-oxoacyl-[acyl-carrier protein] reductase
MCVLITGGSRGIGAAIARQFAREGQEVALSYLGAADKARAVAAECSQLGGRRDRHPGGCQPGG